MSTPVNVLVLGHGEMGRAMERLLRDRCTLAIWDAFPRAGFRSAVLPEAAPRADIVIFCLPTAPHAEVLAGLVPLLAPGCICLSVAKGLDRAGRPVARILEAALGERFGYGVLHGPMIAEEIQAGGYGFAQLAGHGPDVVPRVTALFAGTRLKLTVATDLIGTNWAVVLKNVYALAFGMADELGHGDNVRGWLAATALAEMDVLVRRFGGEAGTVQGRAGLGDLIATVTSHHSRHHLLGRRLARGDLKGLDGEALNTLAVMSEHRLLDFSGLPLLRGIYRVVRDRADARATLGEILAS